MYANTLSNTLNTLISYYYCTFKGFQIPYNTHITHFKHLYNLIWILCYAFKYFKTYSCLLPIDYAYMHLLPYTNGILISLYALFCRLCRYFAFISPHITTLLFIPCLYALNLLLNLNTFVFHSLKGINIFNLCRLCRYFGLV